MPRWNNPNCGFQKGNKYLRKNYSHSEETKIKISLSQKGIPRPQQSNEKHGGWRGDNVSYSGLHHWVRKYKGKAYYCLFAKTLYSECSNHFEWANLSHEYKRDLTDWISLCKKHHYKYDKNYWGVGNKIYSGKNKTKIFI